MWLATKKLSFSSLKCCEFCDINSNSSSETNKHMYTWKQWYFLQKRVLHRPPPPVGLQTYEKIAKLKKRSCWRILPCVPLKSSLPVFCFQPFYAFLTIITRKAVSRAEKQLPAGRTGWNFKWKWWSTLTCHCEKKSPGLWKTRWGVSNR